MSTIADLIRSKPDQYQQAIACFTFRNVDRENNTVTFHFADESTLTFKISYTLDEEREVTMPATAENTEECAHSYANKLGCPECGEAFGAAGERDK